MPPGFERLTVATLHERAFIAPAQESDRRDQCMRQVDLTDLVRWQRLVSTVRLVPLLMVASAAFRKDQSKNGLCKICKCHAVMLIAFRGLRGNRISTHARNPTNENTRGCKKSPKTYRLSSCFQEPTLLGHHMNAT